MMETKLKIKICGLTRSEDCLAINRCRVDYAGFVFASSRRRIEPSRAAELVRLLNPSILPVGVFVDQPVDLILDIVRTAGLAVVQLHGAARAKAIRQLRRQLPPETAIWQRLAVPLELPAEQARHQAQLTVDQIQFGDVLPDAWLLDSSRNGQVGGTGASFDWRVFTGFGLDTPLVLAGGLTAENVRSAVEILWPAVVDTSSGVETGGFKDEAKIRQFCDEAVSVSIIAE